MKPDEQLEARAQLTLGRLNDAMTQAKELISELNSSQKALKATYKELETFRKEVIDHADNHISERIEPMFVEGLKSMDRGLSQGLTLRADIIQRELLQHYNLCAYGNPEGTGTNIFELLRRVAKRALDVGDIYDTDGLEAHMNKLFLHRPDSETEHNNG